MKKLAALLAFSTVLAFGATAQAAEMVEPTIYDWTGFYVGGNIGYGFEGRDRVGAQPTEPGVKGDKDLGELKIQGIFGGGQIGADWQTGSFVFGAIADVEGADIHDDFTTKTSSLSDNVHGSDDIDVWGTFRGRAGWAFDRWLVYGTGGLAWADVDYNLRITPGAKDDEIGKHDVRFGWTAGGGVAWAFDDSWSVGAEYLYVNLGKYSVDGGKAAPWQTQATPDFHSVKGFVNFKF
jgi:outer membrane immunogenic protein